MSTGDPPIQPAATDAAPPRSSRHYPSGGPASVYEPEAQSVSAELFQIEALILGICYGMQLMTHQLGGRVTQAAEREYGHAELLVDTGCPFRGFVGRPGLGVDEPW